MIIKYRVPKKISDLVAFFLVNHKYRHIKNENELKKAPDPNNEELERRK